MTASSKTIEEMINCPIRIAKLKDRLRELYEIETKGLSSRSDREEIISIHYKLAKVKNCGN